MAASTTNLFALTSEVGVGVITSLPFPSFGLGSTGPHLHQASQQMIGEMDRTRCSPRSEVSERVGRTQDGGRHLFPREMGEELDWSLINMQP